MPLSALAAITKYDGLGDPATDLFLVVLEAGSLRSRCWQGRLHSETFSHGCGRPPPQLTVLLWEMENVDEQSLSRLTLLGSSSYKDTCNPITGVLPS